MSLAADNFFNSSNYCNSAIGSVSIVLIVYSRPLNILNTASISDRFYCTSKLSVTLSITSALVRLVINSGYLKY